MRKRIIACDDEPLITRTLELVLRRGGYCVETFANGALALEAVQERVPDLLITDYQMPEMDGLTLCSHLQANFRTKRLPVLMLTAKEMELSPELLKQHKNIVTCFGKPFSPRRLTQAVVNLLNWSSGEREIGWIPARDILELTKSVEEEGVLASEDHLAQAMHVLARR